MSGSHFVFGVSFLPFIIYNLADCASLYGYPPNRAGFIRCPFHGGGNEKTPSCRLYDHRFHCFGCGADGDATAFVARLFSLSPRHAAQKLNSDFLLGLNLTAHRPTSEEVAAAAQRKQEQALKAAFDRWRFDMERMVSAALYVANHALVHGTPQTWTPQETAAIRWREWLESVSDCLLDGDPNRAILHDRKGVELVCRRILPDFPHSETKWNAA